MFDTSAFFGARECKYCLFFRFFWETVDCQFDGEYRQQVNGNIEARVSRRKTGIEQAMHYHYQFMIEGMSWSCK